MVRSKSNTTSFVWELETEGGSDERSMAIVKSVQDRYEWLIATSGALDWSSSGGGARLGNDVPTAGGKDDEKIFRAPKTLRFHGRVVPVPLLPHARAPALTVASVVVGRGRDAEENEAVRGQGMQEGWDQAMREV